MSHAALAATLPLPVVFPLVGAIIAPLAARLWARLTVVVSCVALAGSLVMLLIVAPTVFSGHVISHYMGHWGPVRGVVLGISFAADPFGMVFALAVASIGMLILISTLSELGGLGARELGGYACLVQLLLAALIGVALTADIFNLFVWFEVAALASYGLTGFFIERPIALEAAFKILVLTTMAGFAIFLGAGLLYARHGALNFGQLHDALIAGVTTSDLIALGLLIAGFATKAGLVPFHGWLADAHTAAPGPVSALFSGLMVNLGVVAIVRLGFQLYPTSHTSVLGLLMVGGIVSALVGATMALAQDDLKRLLAYDTISQMGVLAIGFATGTASGVAGATYHLLNHALFKSLLFLVAGAIVHTTGATRLSEMGAIGRRSPWLAAAFVLGALSIAGIPPLNGYVSLSLIHRGLLERHEYVAYALMLVAQLITIAALGRATWLVFFRSRPRSYERTEPLRAGMIVALTGLACCCVAFGVLPGQSLDAMMRPAAGGLLDSARYVTGVLTGYVRLPVPSVSIDYADPQELVTVVISTVLALFGLRHYLRAREPTPIRLLRAAHTGSVNDYTAYAVVGLLVVVAALALR